MSTMVANPVSRERQQIRDLRNPNDTTKMRVESSRVSRVRVSRVVPTTYLIVVITHTRKSDIPSKLRCNSPSSTSIQATDGGTNHDNSNNSE
jgi:hypothetical protein